MYSLKVYYERLCVIFALVINNWLFSKPPTVSGRKRLCFRLQKQNISFVLLTQKYDQTNMIVYMQSVVKNSSF